MEFEWDEAKNRTNELKHGIRFEDALGVFDDPARLTEQAHVVRKERRFQTIGKANRASVLFVVHTARTHLGPRSVTRIISARPASRKERQRYDSRDAQDRSL